MPCSSLYACLCSWFLEKASLCGSGWHQTQGSLAFAFLVLEPQVYVTTLGVPHHSQCVCSKQLEENESWVEEPPIVFNKNRARKFDGYSIKLIVLPLVRKSSEKYFINISIHYFIWQLLGMRYMASIVPGTWLIDGNKTGKILIFFELRFQRF